MNAYREKLLSISFGKGIHPETVRENQLSADLDAYARLKKNGTQPPKIDGCADLEKKASSIFEVTLGKTAADKKSLQRARSVVRDMDK